MSLTLLLASGIGVYGSFFAQPTPKPNLNPPVSWNDRAPARPAKPSVVCGMTLIPADPAIDPAMKHPKPAGTFTMRTIEPQICKR